MIINLSGIVEHSFVDGPGVRFTIFFQGCSLHCKGCHNEPSWNPDDGVKADQEFIMDWIGRTKHLDGVTFSGGDPLEQLDAVYALSEEIKTKYGYNIWCYTGRKFEDLTDEQIEKLKFIDVLVDGPFIEELKSESSIYRGSSNQRLVDVGKSKSYKVVEIVT